jgi:hypothetical protein
MQDQFARRIGLRQMEGDRRVDHAQEELGAALENRLDLLAGRLQEQMPVIAGDHELEARLQAIAAGQTVVERGIHVDQATLGRAEGRPAIFLGRRPQQRLLGSVAISAAYFPPTGHT